jgi:minor extracellular protease Epr
MAAGIRKTVALAGLTLLIVGPQSTVLSPAWWLPSSALADPGGNGHGKGNGASSGNGGNSGEHPKDGNGPGSNGNGNGNGASSGNGGSSGEHPKDGNGPGSNGNGNGASSGNGSNSGEPPNDGNGSGSNGNGDGASSGNADNSGEDPQDGDGAGSNSASGTAIDQTNAAAATAEPDGRDYVQGELVVADLGGGARNGIRRLGFVVLDEQRLASLGLTISRLRVPRQMTTPAARTLLARRYPDVLVDLNAVYRPQGQLVLPPPDYPAKLIGWGRVPDACGEGVRIGLLDTAVDTESPGLREAHVVQRTFLPIGATMASTEHGTAIASILVGQQAAGGTGLLPGAELAVAGAFGADPDGVPIADVMALMSGLDWLVGSRTAVINMSFAGNPNAVVALALRQVTAGHAIVVAAAGNSGPTAPPAFPANVPGVIGVTAVDIHSQPYAEANRGETIDFAAPGVRIWTPGPTASGSYHTGTSFASPFVTAAVAARLVTGASADTDRVADSLAMTAADLGHPGKDPVFGRGLIQLANPCAQTTQ